MVHDILQVWYYVVLHYIVLFYALLICRLLHCTVLYCIALQQVHSLQCSRPDARPLLRERGLEKYYHLAIALHCTLQDGKVINI